MSMKFQRVKNKREQTVTTRFTNEEWLSLMLAAKTQSLRPGSEAELIRMIVLDWVDSTLQTSKVEMETLDAKALLKEMQTERVFSRMEFKARLEPSAGQASEDYLRASMPDDIEALLEEENKGGDDTLDS